MNLKLIRPLVFFDLETTGLNTATDKIVQISIIKIFPDGKEEKYNFFVNPGIPIPEEATAIHGITNEMVKDKPLFSEIAKKIADIISGCDLAGYNSNRFDIPLLAEEMLKANVDIDFSKIKTIDVQNIFYKKEPRTLVAAYKFYCQKDLENAHSSDADTLATYEILKAQLERYDDLDNNVDFLSKFTEQKKNADLAGFILYDDNGKEIFGFGKYKGQLVEEVLEKDSGYFGWIMNADFPRYTKKVLTQIKLRKKEQR
ncbi:MAG TPA: 3'-5' exonuclease [Bacteroidales bacterium]|nr:3'-5' exonuclease [Bacteroidales bacterium]